MRGLVAGSMVLCFIPFLLHSQIRSTNRDEGRNYAGIGLEFGLTSFHGDIDEGPAPGGIFKNNMAYKIQFNRTFNSTFEIGLRMISGELSGDKVRGTNGSETHLYFTNRFVEYTFESGINLLAFFKSDLSGNIDLFGVVGLGFIDFRTKLYNANNDTVISAFGYNGENATTEFVLPIGLKLLYHISPSSALMLQVTSSRVDTDKLDALAGNSNRDYYNYYSIGYRYKINLNRSAKRFLLQSKSEVLQ